MEVEVVVAPIIVQQQVELVIHLQQAQHKVLLVELVERFPDVEEVVEVVEQPLLVNKVNPLI